MRDSKIDVMKGIAIILMVVCHTDFEHYWWFRRFVHLFHMPIFLMAAGWFFSPAKVSDLKRFVGYCVGKVRHIWLPFVIASTICLAAYPLMFAFHLVPPLHVTGLKILMRIPFMMTELDLLHQLWFLKALFWVYLIYSGIEFVLAKVRVESYLLQTCLAIVFLFCGKYMNWWFMAYFGGSRVFLCYALFHVGRMLRRVNIQMLCEGRGRRWAVLIVRFCVLAVLTKFERLGVAQNSYKCGATVLLASVCGWLFLWSIAAGSRMEALAYVGRHTLIILILHFLAFKLVTICAFACRNDPVTILCKHPTSYWGYGFLIAYSIAGVGLPLLCEFCYSLLAGRFKNVLFIVKE